VTDLTEVDRVCWLVMREPVRSLAWNLLCPEVPPELGSALIARSHGEAACRNVNDLESKRDSHLLARLQVM
jgi:hypothetical protein